MRVSDVILDVRGELLEPVAGFWTDTELLRWANRGQLDFVNRTRCLEGTATMTTEQGRTEYPLPQDWVSSRAIFYNEPREDGTANWIPLIPTNLEKMKQENPNFLSDATETQDVSRKYWIWNHSIFLFPAPNATGRQVKMFFKAKPANLTATTAEFDVDDTLCNAITSFILWHAWKKEKELDLAADAKGDYFSRVRDGLRWVKKQSGDQTYLMDINSNVPFRRSSVGFNTPL